MGLELHLRFLRFGIEMEQAIAAGFIVPPNQSIGFDDRMHMTVRQTTADKFKQIIPLGSFRFTQINPMPIGSKQDNSFYFFFFYETEDFFALFGVSVPWVFASWLNPC